MSHNQPIKESLRRAADIEVIINTKEPRLVRESKRILEHQDSIPIETSVDTQNNECCYVLYFGNRGIELRNKKKPHHHGQRVDFLTIDRRTGAGNLSKKQPLPKAIGPHTHIVDTTAGFGMDAIRLALMGYNVTAIENSPIMAAMLRDGLFRAEQDKEFREYLGGRLTLVEDNSISHLRTIHKKQEIEVIYIDPMFPPKRKKSALPPGHIQALHTIVGYEDKEKTRELIKTAISLSSKRVVIKYPTHAQLAHKNPVAIYEGKTVRYEVYKPNT